MIEQIIKGEVMVMVFMN